MSLPRTSADDVRAANTVRAASVWRASTPAADAKPEADVRRFAPITGDLRWRAVHDAVEQRAAGMLAAFRAAAG